MGLDMWLRAKSKTNVEGTEQTGVCSGIFGMVPVSDKSHNIELGYWRKAHDQLEVILDNLESYIHRNNDDGCCEDYLVTKEEVEDILTKAKDILATHSFDEDGYDITEDYDGFGTWCSKSKWEDTIDFFTKAKELYETDPDAEVYFCMWF